MRNWFFILICVLFLASCSAHNPSEYTYPQRPKLTLKSYPWMVTVLPHETTATVFGHASLRGFLLEKHDCFIEEWYITKRDETKKNPDIRNTPNCNPQGDIIRTIDYFRETFLYENPKTGRYTITLKLIKIEKDGKTYHKNEMFSASAPFIIYKIRSPDRLKPTYQKKLRPRRR